MTFMTCGSARLAFGDGFLFSKMESQINEVIYQDDGYPKACLPRAVVYLGCLGRQRYNEHCTCFVNRPV